MTTDYIKSLNGRFCAIEYLYRNKSEMYYSSIYEYHNGVMKPYRKDHNGDPCSVINGRIDGLFFSTAVEFETMKPFPNSLYGPVRLHIDASVLFTTNCNLYFADFYCHYNVHYVTVVLTPKRSPVDEFCRERLIQLDIFDNPFLILKEISGDYDYYEVMVFSASGFRVEVFYTEPINVNLILRKKHGFFSRVPTVGRGESIRTGIPKNNNCKICNI